MGRHSVVYFSLFLHLPLLTLHPHFCAASMLFRIRVENSNRRKRGKSSMTGGIEIGNQVCCRTLSTAGSQMLTVSHGDIQLSTPFSLTAIPPSRQCAHRQTSYISPQLLLQWFTHKAFVFWGLLALPGSPLGEVFSRWCNLGIGKSVPLPLLQ